MDEKTNELLTKSLRESIEGLECLEFGSAEWLKAVEGIEKMYKVKVEVFKAESDCVENRERTYAAERENDIKKRQLAADRKDRIIRYVISGAEIVIPLIFYGIWMGKGFKFEESGSYTSTTFRNLFSKFKPTKK